MKAKITRGAGFKGLLAYAIDKEGSEIIAGTVAGSTISDYASEFGIVRRLRPEVMKPVWHASLSLPPGERATTDDWEKLSRLFLVRMDFDPDAMQWLAVRHRDRDHDHIHIIVNRIQNDGSLWLGRNDVFQAIQATQEIEEKCGLQKTPGLRKKSSYSPTSNERRMMSRTGERSAKSVVAATLNKILKSGALSRGEFEDACKEAGIECRANVAKTGKMSGYSFSYENHAFPGSKVGWGWKKLSRALGEAEKSTSEVARDLKNAVFSALETGNFVSEMSKKGWNINGNMIFSSCGQEIDLSEWGISPQEIDHAAEVIQSTPAAHRRRSGGILPHDVESYAILALMCPGALAALIALDLLVRIADITEEHRREARREAWKKVHEMASYIEEEKKNGRNAESPLGDRGVHEKTCDGRGDAIESDDGSRRDHGGTSPRDISDMGDTGIGGMCSDHERRGECAVPPGERAGHDTAPLQDDHRSPEDRDPEPRTGEEAHHLDCDPDRLTDLRHLADHLADLAASPIAPAPEDAPPEVPDPLPEEPEIDVEESEEIEEEPDAWTWGR